MAEKVDQMDPDEKIVEIAIERLRVFENHPFRVEMYCLMQSSRQKPRTWMFLSVTPQADCRTRKI